MTQTPGTAAAPVDTDLLCVGCGYNLRTQPPDGVCPECGKGIRATIEFPHLRRSAPRWLTSLVDSVTVLLVAFGFAVACFWVDRGRDEPLPVVLGTTAWALAWFAVWLLTRPEPGGTKPAGRVRAWALRVCATPPYIAAFATPVLLRWLDLWGAFATGACMLFVAPATFLYYDHLNESAHRLPNRRLALQAAVVSALLPLAVVVSMVGTVVLDRWPRSAGQLLTTLPMVGLGGVRDIVTITQIVRSRAHLLEQLPLTVAPSAILTLWALAVLVQFRIAFRAAARAATLTRAPAPTRGAAANTGSGPDEPPA